MTDKEKADEISEQYATSRYFPNDEEVAAYNAAIQMAKWKEQQMIDKACEWLKDNVNDSYLDWYDWEKCRLNKDELLHDFKKAMKGEEE